MKIAVIGTGHVGGMLATGFADKGHIVMLGSRDPDQPRLDEWASEDLEHRKVGDQRAAAEFGEVVIFAVPGRALPETLDAIGRDALEGTTVLDVTNPFASDAENHTIDAYGDEDSGAEYLQREVPSAGVVKAFNEILYSNMLRPAQSPIEVVRIAGDNEHAKRVVTGLAEELGWKVRDLGALKEARELEQGVIARYV